MDNNQEPRGAEIINFQMTVAFNRFTAADRMDVMRWEATNRSSIRLAIHRRRDDDPPEVGEFASIYRADADWAAWGAARQGRNIKLWRSGDGRDIGRFATMGEVLAMVSETAVTAM